MLLPRHKIEMLIIFNEGKYNEFKKTKKSPSDFCKSELKMRDVKSYDYVKNYFEDPTVLVGAIKEYHKISRVQNGEYTLLDLIKYKEERRFYCI